jgi:hypothetical protein
MNLYSIPIHECPECVKQMCDGILFFDNDAIVVLHISSNQDINLYSNDRIFINPTQYETNWGCDFTKIHISNYLYVKDIWDITYVIFLTSNMLMIKSPSDFIKNYDCGFSEQQNNNIKLTPPLLIESYQIDWLSDVLKDYRYLGILEELETDKKYGCIIDGTYVNSNIMDKICYFYKKYYNSKIDHIHCLEEKIIPTIACNLTTNVSESLLYFKSVNLSEFKELLKKNHDYFSKKIDRDINCEIRQYYNTLIYKSIT